MNIAIASSTAGLLPSGDRADYLAHLRLVVAALESGDEEAGELLLNQLLRCREEGLFVNLARLTRELHEAMNEFNLDHRLQQLAGEEIPDACVRLGYVAKLGEDAAHRTLDHVDGCRTQMAVMDSCVAGLRALDVAAALPLAARIAAAGEALKGHFTAISQAQEYQDLSGQVIRRVITLVQNVEGALIKLLHATNRSLKPGSGRISPPTAELAGPAVPGLVGSQSVSQQDADALLLELGF